MRALARPRLLVVSAVAPFPGTAGQQVRVRNTLLALRPAFHVAFLTFAGRADVQATRRALGDFVDEAFVLPSASRRSPGARVWHGAVGALFSFVTGLKRSNYVIGHVELTARRIAEACDPSDYDIVLYEYWHAHRSAAALRRMGAACVLDMHDVLWRSYERQLGHRLGGWARWWWAHRLAAYRWRETAAWQAFDAVIAISEGEGAYARGQLPGKRVIVAPMGIDIDDWPYRWSPAYPPRIGFYGRLSSPANREGVERCVRGIMPDVWRTEPHAELWLVGADPPPWMRALERDSRVHVTGFLPRPADVLATMTAVVCPWRGRFGFRSRLIEVMALGVPVAVTSDAVAGMGLREHHGVLLGDDDARLAEHCASLIRDPDGARDHSRLARRQVEEKFTMSATYGHLVTELLALDAPTLAAPRPVPAG
jgi:glycosyltransferase involved in cell wall biosynthesis